MLTLRANLRAFLAAEDSHVPRPAAVVLRSGHACDDEFELTLAALVGALQFDTGAAISGEKVVALVKISGEWHLAAPNEGTVRSGRTCCSRGAPAGDPNGAGARTRPGCHRHAALRLDAGIHPVVAESPHPRGCAPRDAHRRGAVRDRPEAARYDRPSLVAKGAEVTKGGGALFVERAVAAPVVVVVGRAAEELFGVLTVRGATPVQT